jgi:2-succinyl-6-hydroxy-2,4-cyclohexadiene-1-carboxylate synthase
LATDDERAARRRGDSELAASIEAHGLEAFVDRWQDQALFASQASLTREVRKAQREQRLRQSPVGLANSLRGMGTGTQAYLLPEVRELRVPTLFVTGSLDERYTKLAVQMQREMGPKQADGLPYGEVQVLGSAGHTVHLEQPYYFAMSVVDFLKRVRKQRRRRGLSRI